MKFIDEATIFAKAGDGGPGCKSFRREKYVPFGGPDGGNGGKGGSVIVVATSSQNTLLDFLHKKKWFATNGTPGDGNLKDGKDAKNLIIHVPVGTQIHCKKTGNFIADLTKDEEKFELVTGGRGGKGNAFFKSATKRVPEKIQPGEEGKSGEFIFSLKLIADVGIIGFPNAGKSTLISKLSAAKPKIADYPFTTLTPNLGVAKLISGKKIVLADVPGLIPGAHSGKGLGIKFLKHIERTRVLIHLIDPFHLNDEGENVPAIDQYNSIRSELESYSSDINDLPEIIVINKADVINEERRTEIKDSFMKNKYEILFISAVSNLNLDLLKSKLDKIV